ncbi:hypothetical protein chiPu_0026762 [Chiloscyllium punctatum]|uniref:Uncharacterized protein n=1 Tax=Chiloscyllium punctatum TaxID=137246 RepID=A0A401TIX5_CHIPU|nr:hypothetical protein [Chiloscyllium punctatum]
MGDAYFDLAPWGSSQPEASDPSLWLTVVKASRARRPGGGRSRNRAFEGCAAYPTPTRLLPGKPRQRFWVSLSLLGKTGTAVIF